MISLWLKFSLCTFLRIWVYVLVLWLGAASEELFDSVAFEQSRREDPTGFDAIMQLHRQMDDDLSGSVDLNESIVFVKEELHIEEKDRLARRQRAFHENNDEYVTVEDLWVRWWKSEVRQWSNADMINWLVNYVELPQYREVFEQMKLNGSILPRLACPNGSFMTSELHISNAVHRHKLQLKALDVVLFGFRQHTSSVAKDAVLVALLAIAIGGYWFAIYQRKTAQHKLRVLSAHLDRLKDMEQDFTDLQKKMEKAHVQEHSKSSDDILSYDEEEAARRLRMQEMEKELDGRIPMLQKLLAKTYELEVARLNQEKIENLKEMREARELVEKLRKKHSSFVSQIRSVHGSEGEQIDLRIVHLKQKMQSTALSLEEHHQRWAQIELVCGFPVQGTSADGGSCILSSAATLPLTVASSYLGRAPVVTAAAKQPTLARKVLGTATQLQQRSCGNLKSASEVFLQNGLQGYNDRSGVWPTQGVLARSEEVEDLISYATINHSLYSSVNDMAKDGHGNFVFDEQSSAPLHFKKPKIADVGKAGSLASSNSGSSKEDGSESTNSTTVDTKKRSLFPFKKLKFH
ncbi:Stromal interaction molecule [Trichuris trichiura]|uniref:Stromal interaction molecule n=1 Tax=Trichuris trichiura TaxID=36087 RepID=A0A077ZMT4_TRITR|nr:Stromal interaction molecule [Trichuris trichiura]